MTGGLLFALTGVALFALGGAGVVLIAHLLRRILAFNLMGVRSSAAELGQGLVTVSA